MMVPKQPVGCLGVAPGVLYGLGAADEHHVAWTSLHAMLFFACCRRCSAQLLLAVRARKPRSLILHDVQEPVVQVTMVPQWTQTMSMEGHAHTTQWVVQCAKEPGACRKQENCRSTNTMLLLVVPSYSITVYSFGPWNHRPVTD